MEICKREERNRKYLLFSESEICTEGYAVQLVLHHMLNGLLPCSIYAMDMKKVWSCEYTGKISLQDYCESIKLKKTDVFWVLSGILKNIQEVQEFLLDTDLIYMHIAEIYVDPVEKKVWNVFLPFYGEEIWRNVQELVRLLLGQLDQQDVEAVHLLYSIYQYLEQGGRETEEIWKLLYGKEEKTPVFETDGKDFTEDRKLQRRQSEQQAYDTDFNKYEGEKGTSAYSYIRWFFLSLPMALALFTVIYVALNEWYLSAVKKLVFLLVSVVLVGISVFLWKKWKVFLRKENPIEGSEKDVVGDSLDRGTVILQRNRARLEGKKTEECILISQTPVLIGKDMGLAQIIIENPVISRKHAKISMRETGDYYIEDMNSTNGTYVNGRRLEAKKPVRLRDGDVLVFANCGYYFRL